MFHSLSRFKPGVSRRSHLFLSALLWTAIGMLLLGRGMVRFDQLTSWQPLIISVVAILLGSLKAHFILDKSARRGIERILTFKDGTCLGAVYSIKTWIMVFCMMGIGIYLRNSSMPVNLLCLLYLTIGWALLVSSRLAWKAWQSGK